MTTVPGPSALRLIITLLISTLLFSCGGGNPASDGAGIAFQVKWPAAKSVGSVPSAIPPGVVMIRMSVSGPDMKTMRADFIVSPTSPRTGSIENVPVGINRTITLQGLASNGDIIFQDVDANVTLKSLVSDPPYSHAFDMKLIATSSTPTAPSGLSATAISTGQVDLAWVNNANNESGYKIERAVSGGTYTEIATVAANDTTYTDTTPSANTIYDYRVQAVDDVANSVVNVATATTTVVVPASTYSISGTVTSSGTALEGATVTRYLNGSTTKTTDSGGNYSFDGTQNGNYTLTPAKTGYTFNPPNMAVTVDGADKSAVNFVATAVETIPAAPTGLSATAYASNLIYLAWVDKANNETGYIIERSTTGVEGSFAPVPVAANVTVFTDTTVSAATTYYYRVRATNGVGDSLYSGEASVTTLAPTYGISGSITSGGTAMAGATVTLTLAGSGSTTTTTNSSGTYSFSGAQNGDYTLTPSRTDYTFSPASLAVTVSGANQSAMNFVAAPVPIIPAAPSGLVATAVSSNLINLSWKDNSSNETGYRIERSESGGTYAPIATVAANVTTYKDTVPAASTAYFYRVQATSGAGDSGYSNEANATTLAAGAITLPELVPVTGTLNFSIGKFEVTQREWLSVMPNNPSLNPACGLDCPVENVSWLEIQDFIITLNLRSGSSYRLPTEAEWQYAAQSGGLNETYSGGSDVNAVAWYSPNSGNTIHPVGQKLANGLGIHDMSGNANEWVNDRFGSTGNNKVIRGGSWRSPASAVETIFRSGADWAAKGNNIGFRLAR